jgi:dCMP deaminase|tara:strand:- start:510 stop:959 length:450 start_codon:yes stop_codon:yes gene_type:complete
MVFSLKRNKKPTKWDFAHMRTAMNYANLSHAQRLKVGCVIVKDNRIISIGYNGQPAGWDNKCEYFDEQKNDLVTYDTVIHAESNAITKVAMSSESCYNATIYTTTAPCIDCAKLIYQSGISKVYYKTKHLRCDDGIVFLQKSGVTLCQL